MKTRCVFLACVSLIHAPHLTQGQSPSNSESEAGAEAIAPILNWRFDQLPDAIKAGKPSLIAEPPKDIYPSFDANNQALRLPLGASLRWREDDLDANVDFDNGDTITVEAWVRIDSIRDNAYVIGKGRSGTSGTDGLNQNWAVRLRNRNGHPRLNFLFRSLAPNTGDVTLEQRMTAGQWHRWTSDDSLAVGPRWHHIAIRYRFGEPESISGFIDGQRTGGTWDMGGPTQSPPVVDDSDIWIGSAMGGASGNSLDGAIDELKLYRGHVPDEVLMSRYAYVPEEITAPSELANQVVMQLLGPFTDYRKFPLRSGSPRLTWERPAMAFSRLPTNYDDSGVIDDWTDPQAGTMLVRSWARVDLDAGQYQFMVRSRGLCRLFVDGEQILITSPQRNRGSAHHVVDPIPEVPVDGMRPHYMNDQEQVATIHSEGGTHWVRFEAIVGAKQYTLRVGETCVAIAKLNDKFEPSMFHLLSAARDIPLTDEGWNQLAAEEQHFFDSMDRQRRKQASRAQDAYWQQRHEYARQIMQQPASAGPSIDQLIHERVAAHNAIANQSQSLNKAEQGYLDSVAPILQKHCARCHSEKHQGGLDIASRANLLTGGDSGMPAVVPGKISESQLWELVSADPDDYRMPPEGPGLSTAEQKVIRTWIESDAPMPAQPSVAIQIPPVTDDFAFLRRVYLDCIGVVPTLAEINAFLAAPAESRRADVVDRLLNDRRWADHWTSYWQDNLAENPNLLKPTLNNTGPFRFWIHDALEDNKPLDRFASELIMMRGSSAYGGTAGFALASQNDAPMAAKANVIGNAFLGVEMKCARCHDAPYHDWDQSDLFQMAAMLERQPIQVPETSTVPAAFFESRSRKSLISATLQAGQSIDSQWPLDDIHSRLELSLLRDADDPRERMAFMVTASRRFAEVMANRIWARLMGSGIVEPIHDWQGQTPSDPQLLGLLADMLIEAQYDQRKFVRSILLSEAYQRQCVDDARANHFASPSRRRMSAEQIVDSALVAVGQDMRTEMLTLDLEGAHKPDWFFNFGHPERAWQFTTLANERDRPSLALPRAQAVADVLKAFGWRNSRPEPISQRDEDPNLVQPGALANGTFGNWLTRLSDDSGLTEMMLQADSVDQLVEDLFLRCLTRRPSPDEQQQFVELLRPGFSERRVPTAELPPPPARKRFRNVSWSNHLNTEANKIKVEMEALARQGDPPTRFLQPDWRARAEDAVWALINSPEMILIP